MLNEERNDIPANLWVVKIDETEYWDESCLKDHPCIKRIFGVYMVDMNERTFCCEATPSYFLRFLQNEWDGEYDNDEASEAASDLMMEPWDEPGHYFHCHTIDDAPTVSDRFFPKGNIGRIPWGKVKLDEEDSPTREEAMEDAIQEYFANPV